MRSATPTSTSHRASSARPDALRSPQARRRQPRTVSPPASCRARRQPQPARPARPRTSCRSVGPRRLLAPLVRPWWRFAVRIGGLGRVRGVRAYGIASLTPNAQANPRASRARRTLVIDTRLRVDALHHAGREACERIAAALTATVQFLRRVARFLFAVIDHLAFGIEVDRPVLEHAEAFPVQGRVGVHES